jgi:RimJ/RimL family protein N-acetyltransferase
MMLQTRRLVLREWDKKDTEDLVEGLNDLAVAKWLAFVPHPYTKKNAGEWITECIRNSKKGRDRKSYEFAIELRSAKKVIGGISLNGIDRFQGTAGGGIWLNAKYQMKGYGSEAFEARLRFAFEKLKLRRIENGFLKGNPLSFAMQKKFGYKLEGKRRKGFRCRADGKIKDEYLTGLLREEWRKRKFGN